MQRPHAGRGHRIGVRPRLEKEADDSIASRAVVKRSGAGRVLRPWIRAALKKALDLVAIVPERCQVEGRIAFRIGFRSVSVSGGDPVDLEGNDQGKAGKKRRHLHGGGLAEGGMDVGR
jgi:hypothetical protein